MNLKNQNIKSFFYTYWWLFYLLFFLLIGILIYALFLDYDNREANSRINVLNSQFDNCCNLRQNNVNDSKKTINDSINCNATVKSGGKGLTRTKHELGNSSGMVLIEYDMKKIPDEIKLYYDNNLVASSSGLVSGYHKTEWFYGAKKNKPTYCIVEISAPNLNTEWEYLLGCPK